MSNDWITVELGKALAPLGPAVGGRAAFEALLDRLGWSTELSDDDFATIEGLLPIASSIGTIAQELSAANGNGNGGPDVQVLLTQTQTVLDAIGQLQSLSAQSVASLPWPLDDPQTWLDLAADLPDLIIASYLRFHARPLYTVLRTTGVVGPPEETRSFSDRREVLRFDRLIDLIADPSGYVRDNFGWNNDFIYPLILEGLFQAGRAMGLSPRLGPVSSSVGELFYDGAASPAVYGVDLDLFGGTAADGMGGARFGLQIAPIPPSGSPDDAPVGLYVGPLAWGGSRGTVELGNGWELSVNQAVDLSGVAGFAVRPGEITFESTVPFVTGEVATSYEPPDTVIVLGDEGSARLELGGMRVAFGVSGSATDPELYAEFGTLGEGLRIIIDPSEGDTFLAELLGSATFDAALDVMARWSSKSGFTISGSPTLETILRIDRSIGPITLELIRLAIGADNGALLAQGSVAASAHLGPFHGSLDGVGAELRVGESADGNGTFGKLDVALGFLPPTSLGLSIDMESVTGAGYLDIDKEIGRYVGGLSLDVMTVGIDALTIIDTQLPGDPNGFSLFATLTARFPNIPLGFGFTLNGLGGILGLNRSVDAEALALGLRDGAADAVLFPEDPVRDAQLLVGQLDEYFPVMQGNTVIGPVAEIGWGSPTIITGQLGVVVSWPQGVIVVLGSLEVLLPDPDAPLLELHLDTLGAIDLPNGTLLVVASLYDSRLLGFIELSGDAALYISALNDPYFLLSVGGFHPGFQPPSHVPTVLETLRVMRAEILIGLGVTATVESYFATTSNTVQFGGGFELEASAKYLLVTYTARGWFEFDILIQFTPFLIVADASAGVGVFANNKELFGVSLAAHLEGPEPWFATGSARFKFFGINVKFDFTVGGHAPPAVAPTENVLALMETQLQSGAAWTTERAPGVTAGLVTSGDEAESLIRPDDLVVARQSIAPLDHHLARFGELTPIQDEVTVSATSVVDPTTGETLDGVEVEDVADWFAPAQYSVMRDETRLSSPSYEQMTAGVRFGASGVAIPDDDRISAPAGHETEIWQPTLDRTRRLDNVLAPRNTADVVAASRGAAVTASIGARQVDVEPVSVGRQTYVAVDDVSGVAVSEPTSFEGAVATASAGGTRVVPTHAGRSA